MNHSTADSQAQLFKALMHPARIQILDLLRDDEQCVCHLEAHLGLRQAYISQQLAILRKAGLILDRRDGLNIFYRVTRLEVFTLLDTARALLGSLPDREPHRPVAVCPCPKCMGDTATIARKDAPAGRL